MATLVYSCFKAMFAKFNANQAAGSPHALTGGRFHFAEAPPKRTYPYIVAEVSGSEENSTFVKTGDELVFILNAVGQGRAQLNTVLQIVDALLTLFRGASLTFSGSDYVNYNLRPGSISGPEMQNDLAMAAIPFRLSVEET